MKSRDILFISSIRWDFSWHRQQELMTMMAAKGYRILFVQPCIKKHPFHTALQQVHDQIWVLEMPGLPYERVLGTVHWINARISRFMILKTLHTLGFSSPIVWLDRVHGFDYPYFSKNHFVIYDLVDEILSFGRVRNEKLLLHLENRVLQTADLVLSSSETLRKRKVSQSQRTGKTLFLPNGVDTERFQQHAQRKTPSVPDSPRIGFVGHISTWRLDYQLIHQMAALRPHWQFVFIGPGTHQEKEALQRNNIQVLDAMPADEIPAVISSFDVGIIPYLTKGKVDYVFPRKACEYLASGLGVVSTPLPECDVLQPYVQEAETPEAFIQAIENHLKQTNLQQERMLFAQRFDWRILLECLLCELP